MLRNPRPPAEEPSTQTEQEDQFCKARALLHELINLPSLRRILDEDEVANARKVYTQAPTLWLLVFQRLGRGLSLSAAVTELLDHHRDILPDNRRVREGTLAENNSAYNKARKRLPLQIVQEFSQRICDHLAAQSEPVFQGRRVFIFDGTTITLPPTEELREEFPPATNQKGESVWPVARLMVAGELRTGCALLPQIDPMYGPNNKSEGQQAEKILPRLPPHSVVLADAGFGIFRFAFDCQRHGKEFVLRLTAQRFEALRKRATVVDEGVGYRSYHLLWQPTAKERRKNAHWPEDAAVEVLIHEVELDNGSSLFLVSNLEVDAGSVSELYERRYDVEFDIRDLKVTMDTENLRAKHSDTVKKELMGSVIAFNLVTQVRRQAAKLANVEPRRLSFSGVWLSLAPAPSEQGTELLRGVASGVHQDAGQRRGAEVAEAVPGPQLPASGASASAEVDEIPKAAPQPKTNRPRPPRLTRK